MLYTELWQKNQFSDFCDVTVGHLFIGWHILIWSLDLNFNWFVTFYNGNPNLKLSYRNIALYCRKQHTNFEKSQIIEQNIVFPLWLLSVYYNLRFLCLPQQQSFFSSWTHYSTKLCRILNNTSEHSSCIYFCFLVWKCFL